MAAAGLAAYIGVSAGLLLLVGVFRADGGEGPAQPIAFDHGIHAGDLALDCTHCHQFVEVSRFPGLPSTDVCMACHEVVATDRPEIQKLTQYWEEGREPEWVKVYEVPWHVYFSHKRHVKAGVDCSNCHGDVTVQTPIRQVRSLKMGWCVSCHRENEASTDCWTCHK
jgi:hypothetical protein